jgi:hypothetical protein
LVVFDSLADFLTAAGAEDNSNSDFGRWFAEFITPLKRQGVAVLVLDHVPKSIEGTAHGPRGAGAKTDKVDVQWSLKVVRRFGREQVGEVELTRSKDREGLVPRTVSFTIGGGVFERETHSSPVNSPALTQNEQKLLERTLRAGEDGVRRKDLEVKLNGNKGSASRALKGLERYGLIEKYGAGRGTHYVAVRTGGSETGMVPKTAAVTPTFDGTTRYQDSTTVPRDPREAGKSTNGTSTLRTGTVGTHPSSDPVEQAEDCIHDYPGGVGCYLCDPDHPYRRVRGEGGA